VGATDGGLPAQRDGNVTDIYDGLYESVNIQKVVECTANLFTRRLTISSSLI